MNCKVICSFMNKSWIDKTRNSKFYEFYQAIVFLPRKKVDEKKKKAQTIIMIDFHIKNSKIINLLR